MKKLLPSLIVAAAAFAAGQAHAIPISFTALNQTGVVLYSTTYSGATLSAEVDYKLTAWTANSATFSITATNNSSGAGTNRLTAFGIGVITPALTGVADNSGVWDTAINTTFPGFQQVAFCAYAGPTCSGGGGGGLAESGGTVTFNVTMSFGSNDPRTGITFDSPYTIKYQAAGTTGKSVEFGGCVKGDTNCGGTPPVEIPEPGTLALAGMALLGLAAARRRFI